MDRSNKIHENERATAARPAPQQTALKSPEHERPLKSLAALQRATDWPPSALRHADIITLQRTIGNRGVQRMLHNQARTLRPRSSASANVTQTPSAEEAPIQAKFETSPRTENRTGLPDNLKAGIENLSGMAMDDVRVHYNSSAPAKVQALAFTQGTNIHVAPNQEKHLPHEAWHVVQQKQGRVRPTGEFEKTSINDDPVLESEADRMGSSATSVGFSASNNAHRKSVANSNHTVQAVWVETQDKGVSKWNVPIDGVNWFSDSDGMMWFEIAKASLIKEGKIEDYKKLQGQKKSWHEWNEISISPHPDWSGFDPDRNDLPVISQIQVIANMNRTGGVWYAWGKDEYMIMWEKAESIRKHGLSIKEGSASPQGPGLYLAKDAWRSSTYATPGAYLLVAFFAGVPTIDAANGAQMTALGRLGLTLEDLYETKNLADMLLMYSPNYARLTTNEGVKLTTDLSKVDLSLIKAQYAKFGSDAKLVVKEQAKVFGLDLSKWT